MSRVQVWIACIFFPSTCSHARGLFCSIVTQFNNAKRAAPELAEIYQQQVLKAVLAHPQDRLHRRVRDPKVVGDLAAGFHEAFVPRTRIVDAATKGGNVSKGRFDRRANTNHCNWARYPWRSISMRLRQNVKLRNEQEKTYQTGWGSNPKAYACPPIGLRKWYSGL